MDEKNDDVSFFKNIKLKKDERGLLRLPALTNSQQDFLLEELALDQEEDRKEALARIESIVREYDNFLGWETSLGSPPTEKVNAEKALASIKRARNDIRNLGPRALLPTYVMAEDMEIPTLDELPDILDYWRGWLENFLDSHETPSGRPKLFAMDNAIRSLASFYAETTSRQPGYSSPPVTKPGSLAIDIHGPFVRFCTKVIGLRSPTNSSTIGNMVRKVLNQRKKQGKIWE